MSDKDIDVLAYNRESWNQQSNTGESPWVQPVNAAEVARARAGDWSIILTPNIAVPAAWFDGVADKDVLCLASGGGQQTPILAAAGGRVTSFDNSPVQLAKDRAVAERENLHIRLEQGDMADLSRFEDDSFDLIFHPVSNVFCEDIEPVWRECFRVLRARGRLLSGFMNPAYYLFDHEALERGEALTVRFRLPYADITDLTVEELDARMASSEGLEFSHSLDAQIGGQLAAGFRLEGFYEDRWDNEATPLNGYMPTSMATLAVKPE